jgi:hypothetical protein
VRTELASSSSWLSGEVLERLESTELESVELQSVELESAESESKEVEQREVFHAWMAVEKLQVDLRKLVLAYPQT